MSKSYICAYYGCTKCQKKNKELSFFKFPVKKLEVIDDWKKNCGNVDIALMDNESLTRKVICSNHFREQDIYSNAKRKLLRCNAIPIPWKWRELLPNANSTTTVPSPGSKIAKASLRKEATSTQSLSTDEFEPIEDLGNENSLKRKRNEELESILSNTCENYIQPSTSQICKIDRPLVPTETYTSYKQKYKELLDTHNSLKQELQQLKDNIITKEKVVDTNNMTPVKRSKVDYAQISHSEKEIEELGKCWTQEFSRLRPDQQMYAKEAIKKVLAVGKINDLHSNSVKINYEYDNTVREETNETNTGLADANNLSSINEEFGDVIVKTEHTGIEIYADNENDDPIASMNDHFVSIIVKTEEPKIEVCDHIYDLNLVKDDFDSINVKTEEIDDIYDENNDGCGHLNRAKIKPDSVAVRVQAEETEIYDCNSDNSDNRCLLEIEKDNSDIITSEEQEIFDSRKDNVLNFDIKVEKNA